MNTDWVLQIQSQSSFDDLMRGPIMFLCEIQDSPHREVTHFHTLLSVPMDTEKGRLEEKRIIGSDLMIQTRAD